MKHFCAAVMALFVFFILPAAEGRAFAAGVREDAAGLSEDAAGVSEDVAGLPEDNGDYEAIEATLSEMTTSGDISFTEIKDKLLAGDFGGSLKTAAAYAADKIFGELRQNRRIMGQMIGISILGAIFTNFSVAFAGRYVAESGFYLTYMVVFSLLMTSFLTASSIAGEVVSNLINLMKAIIPAFCMALTFSSGLTTSGAFYEVMMIGVVAADWVLAGFIMNFIRVYVVLAIVNSMTKEDYLSRMAELLRLSCGWVMKTILAVTLGINMIQSMVLPAFDSVKNGVLAKAAGAIPGLGNTFGMAAKAAVGSGVLLKNAVGGAGVIVIIIVCAVPLIKLLVIALMYKLVEAVIQPVSDARLTECVHAAGEGIFLLFKTAGTVILLFVISLAMMTSASNLGV